MEVTEVPSLRQDRKLELSLTSGEVVIGRLRDSDATRQTLVLDVKGIGATEIHFGDIGLVRARNTGTAPIRVGIVLGLGIDYWLIKGALAILTGSAIPAGG